MTIPATRLWLPSVCKIAGQASRICSKETGPVSVVGASADFSSAFCVAAAVTCQRLSGAGVVETTGRGAGVYAAAGADSIGVSGCWVTGCSAATRARAGTGAVFETRGPSCSSFSTRAIKSCVTSFVTKRAASSSS